MLASVQAELEDEGVYFLNLTVEEKDDKDIITKWLADYKASSLHAGSASSTVSQTLHKMAGLEQGGIPVSILISPDGNVVGGHMGAQKRDEIVKSAKSIKP